MNANVNSYSEQPTVSDHCSSCSMVDVRIGSVLVTMLRRDAKQLQDDLRKYFEESDRDPELISRLIHGRAR